MGTIKFQVLGRMVGKGDGGLGCGLEGAEGDPRPAEDWVAEGEADPYRSLFIWMPGGRSC